MRWLISGATGFVGQKLAERLRNQGEPTVQLARPGGAASKPAASKSPETYGHRPWKYAEVSLGDPNGIAQHASGCDVAVHTAAVHLPGSAPRAMRWVNVAGTENVLNACIHAGVKRLILVSCADVTLQNCDRVHWDEERLGFPLTHSHGDTKRLAEDLVLARNGDGIETVALRPAQLWGPGDRSFLPRLVREARAKGGVQLAGSGANLISVTYIDHLVDALLAAATAEAAPGEVFYVTDNEFLTSEEFFGAVSSTFHLPTPRRGWPYSVCYGLGRLRERLQLGTQPTDLTSVDIIRRGRPTFFNIHSAISKLDFEPTVSLTEGLNRWRAWVESLGGLDTLLEIARAPDSASAVDAMVLSAGGEDA